MQRAQPAGHKLLRQQSDLAVIFFQKAKKIRPICYIMQIFSRDDEHRNLLEKKLVADFPQSILQGQDSQTPKKVVATFSNKQPAAMLKAINTATPKCLSSSEYRLPCAGQEGQEELELSPAAYVIGQDMLR